jgi:hypothetical protein
MSIVTTIRGLFYVDAEPDSYFSWDFDGRLDEGEIKAAIIEALIELKDEYHATRIGAKRVEVLVYEDDDT